MSEDLLRLLEAAHPGRSRADLLAIIEATPDREPAKALQKPVQRRVGSRPRTSESMERRRSWAASGRLPVKLACKFTLAEQAALSVVAAEVQKHGTCTVTIGLISAVAGVSETTVRNAIREARALGLVTVEEKRRTAWMSYPNTVRIVSPEWASWLRLHGFKSVKPTPKNSRKQDRARSASGTQKGFRNEEAAQAPRQTSKGGSPQGSKLPYSAPDRGFPPKPGMDRGSAKGMPSVQRWGMHGNARLRGA